MIQCLKGWVNFIFIILFFIACKKNSNDTSIVHNELGAFNAQVFQRTATTATLQWTASVNTHNADTVKYDVYLGNDMKASGLTVLSQTLNGLAADSLYEGVIKASTASGDTASAPFIISRYQPTYSHVTGYYRVTESVTTLSTGQSRQFVFTAEANLINDSTVRFIQMRRVPTTWWTVDFNTQIFPSWGDSLVGGGITPRGRILDANTMRISYMYGSSIVYQVRQLWEKFTNPQDTSTVVYQYPNVANMITTVAGKNTSGSGSGSSGDGGPATQASLINPIDVVTDAMGRVYLNDGGTTYSIRKVDIDGNITRFAGNNTSGFSGDGGLAVNAQLNYPQGLALDQNGNLYISDMGNRVIRKVAASGLISTFAGTPGVFGYAGDGGAATSAQLGAPAGICVDGSGNIYFADAGKHVIRKISNDGMITTVAGTGNTSGYAGDGGMATSAKLYTPTDICVDAQGNLFIADKDNHCIRKVDVSGIITTIAGLGGSLNYGFTGDGGIATTAKLNKPQSVSVDATGNIYISDYGNNRIRKVTSNGFISTIGGNGQSAVMGDGPAFYGGDYGPATAASIFAPYGNFWINNTLYIATSYRIRKIQF